DATRTPVKTTSWSWSLAIADTGADTAPAAAGAGVVGAGGCAGGCAGGAGVAGVGAAAAFADVRPGFDFATAVGSNGVAHHSFSFCQRSMTSARRSARSSFSLLSRSALFCANIFNHAFG